MVAGNDRGARDRCGHWRRVVLLSLLRQAGLFNGSGRIDRRRGSGADLGNIRAPDGIKRPCSIESRR